MPDPVQIKDEKVHELSRYEHVRKGNVSAKRVVLYGYDASTDTMSPFKPGLAPSGYDYVSVAYPTSSSEVYTFKSGGSGGDTLGTVTVTYTNSTKENLATVALT